MRMSADNGNVNRKDGTASEESFRQTVSRVIAASEEQVSADEHAQLAVASVANGINESATALEKLAHSQRSVADMAKSLQAGVDANATTTRQIAASIATS